MDGRVHNHSLLRHSPTAAEHQHSLWYELKVAGCAMRGRMNLPMSF